MDIGFISLLFFVAFTGLMLLVLRRYLGNEGKPYHASGHRFAGIFSALCLTRSLSMVFIVGLPFSSTSASKNLLILSDVFAEG
jgi:hypothetical protein